MHGWFYKAGDTSGQGNLFGFIVMGQNHLPK